MSAEPLQCARDWLAAGRGVALARVVRTWGSSPCPPGSLLAVDDSGRFEGSVSGGCVETAVIEAARELMPSGGHRLLEFGVSNERAWEVGLACGGTVLILVQAVMAQDGLTPALLARLVAARRGGDAVALLTRLGDGTNRIVPLDAPQWPGVSDDEAVAVRRAARGDRCELLEYPAGDVFVQTFQRPLRLVIVGAVHIAQYLAAQAAGCGFEVIVVDPRTAFASRERFPGTTVRAEWPDAALTDLGLDRRTALVTLSHDPKLDDPALGAALRSDAYYVGALGSGRNHARRLARLREQGFGDDALARVHGPAGLDIGARSPAEIAVAILAQMIAALRTPQAERAQPPST
jgi:xanthine dehydrogenase accessory factor